MRAAILIFVAGLTFAATPARAQSAWLERDMVGAVCSRQATPAAGKRLARRLNLTDPQKSAQACRSQGNRAQASSVLRHPGREAEESVRHWRPHRRHIQLVGQDIKQQRTASAHPPTLPIKQCVGARTLLTAGTRRRRCGNTIPTDKAEDGGRTHLPRGGTRSFV